MVRRNSISDQLRTRMQAICDAWELRVRAELPVLDRFDNPALVDHLPEFLEALSRWVEGDSERALPGLQALAEGHAVQRLGYGIDLATLTREYALLRSALISECGEGIASAGVELFARLDEALDTAILGAVRFYTSRRDEGRDRFIGILAHDLRNPLNAISIATESLLEAPHDASTLRGLQTIARSAARMERMVEDVIDLAREHLGDGIPLVLRPGNLGDLCREALDEIAAGHPQRAFDLSISGELEGTWDRERVLQAMSNVIGNAVQHGLDPITVSVHESADRQAVVTIVRNAGPAPSRESLSTMFEPFRTQAASAKNLGLGLYIVRAIARAHGAVCDAETGPDGTGFVFRIVWPRVPNEQLPLRGTSPRSSSPA